MVTLLLTIALIGLLVWALTTFIPMPDGFKKAIYAVGIIVVILMALSAFGVAVPLHLP